MSRIIGGRSCRSCEHSRMLDATGAPHCLRFPPQVFALLVPTPQGPSMQINSVYPTVNPDLPCGEYRRSEAKAMDEVSGPPVGGVT